ncbi:MAG: hypothetical protein GC162_16435 [Planctomycetes bacterium]|nr:hypothetical protein [Planctomycetota bacterium]
MIRATRRFTDEDRQRVNAAVAAAEKRTSAEIVPVIAASSGRYDRAEDIVGLWAAMIAMAIVFVMMPVRNDEPGSWAGSSMGVTLLVMLLSGVIAFIIGAVTASYAWRLRRLFTPGKQMRDEANGRARQAFFDSTVWRTAGATGVMIYISLYERRAVVLADQSVIDKLGAQTLDNLCGQLTAGLVRTDVITALCEAIAALGEKLEPVLPRAADDVNELPDGLVVID